MSTDLLAELLGDYTDHGSEKSFDCPFCERTGRSPDREQKLWVNERKGMFICYRCETKGTIGFMLRMLGHENIEQTVEVTKLAKRMRKLQGLPVEEEFAAEEDDTPVIDYMQEVIKHGCRPIEVGSVAWNYLRDRRITDADIEYYDMLEGRGRYSGRVIIPTFDFDGQLAYFVARAFKPLRMRTKDGGYKDAPKYLNPKGEGRRRSVFNLNRAVEHSSILVTEGVFSAVAAGRNAVATFGKLVSEEQLDLIAERVEDREVIVCLDGDAHEQTLEIAHRLTSRKVRATVAILPFEHDPDSIGREGLLRVLADRTAYSTLNVAKLQASGVLHRRRAVNNQHQQNTLDSIRRKLVRS